MSGRRLFALCISMLLPMGVDSVQARDQLEPIAKIASRDASLREQGVSELVRQRKELIRGLIGILKDAGKFPSDEERGAVISAIHVLGEMRAVEAVDTLVHYIDFPASNKPVSHGLRPLGEVYPAVAALIKIGNPSLPAVVEVLKTSTEGDDVVMNNCGWIISHVLSPELVKSYLEIALKAEKDPKKRARIITFLETSRR